MSSSTTPRPRQKKKSSKALNESISSLCTSRRPTATARWQFDNRVGVIEADQALPILLDLKPDVIVITGDHCTYSSTIAGNVPVMIAADAARFGPAAKFGAACVTGPIHCVISSPWLATPCACSAKRHAVNKKCYRCQRFLFTNILFSIALYNPD
jgi:hypothetical protein